MNHIPDNEQDLRKRYEILPDFKRIEHILRLSLSPLLALLIDLRECDVFFLGTARSHGGRSSKRDSRVGSAKVAGLGATRKLGSRDAINVERKKGSLNAENIVLDC